MRRRSLFFGLCAFMLSFSACIPLLEPTTSPADNPDVSPWKAVNSVASSATIRAIHATPFELYFLSNSFFFRLDDKLNLQEKRLLPTDRSFFGAPIISDNVFVRVTQNSNNDAVFEFNLTRNAQIVKKIAASELVDTARRETFVPEAVYDETLQAGCFSTDGTKLLVVGSVNSNKLFAIILDIQLDFAATNFSRISVVKRIELPDLLSKKMESIRFLKDNFYIATQNGGYRVTPTGEVRKVFNHWALDFFSVGATLHSSPFSAYDFHTSTDNGLTWRRGSPSELKYVEVVNNQIITKISRGVNYVNLSDASFTKLSKIKYNPDLFVNTRDAVDFHMRYFKGKYYMNDGAKIFAVDTLRTVK